MPGEEILVAEEVAPAGVRLGEDDADCQTVRAVRRLDGVYLVPDLARDDLPVFVHLRLVGEDEVVGGDRLAVGPRQTLPERELDGLRVFAGDLRLAVAQKRRIREVRHDLHNTLHDRPGYVGCRNEVAADDVAVEDGRLLVEAHDERVFITAAFSPTAVALAAATATAAASGDAKQGGPRQPRAADLQEITAAYAYSHFTHLLSSLFLYKATTGIRRTPGLSEIWLIVYESHTYLLAQYKGMLDGKATGRFAPVIGF